MTPLASGMFMNATAPTSASPPTGKSQFRESLISPPVREPGEMPRHAKVSRPVLCSGSRGCYRGVTFGQIAVPHPTVYPPGFSWMTSVFALDPASTALVLIDLQRGIVAGTTAPHAASAVVHRAARLAAACRARGLTVILVHVDPGPKGVLFPRPAA